MTLSLRILVLLLFSLNVRFGMSTFQVLAPIESVSDDEGASGVVCAGSSTDRPTQRSESPPARSIVVREKLQILPHRQTKAEIESKVLKTVQRLCDCARQRSRAARQSRSSCFAPFRDNRDAQTQIVALRTSLSKLHKADADNKAPCRVGFGERLTLFWKEVAGGKITITTSYVSFYV